MMSDTDKIGDLGDLHSKSVEELQGLIFRQERLLANKTCVNMLKDKGAKIKQLVERIQAVLKVKERIEDATKQLESMTLSTPLTLSTDLDIEKQRLEDTLRQLVNVPSEQRKLVVHERSGMSSPSTDGQSPTQKNMKDAKEHFVPSRAIRNKSVQEMLECGILKSPNATKTQTSPSHSAHVHGTSNEINMTEIDKSTQNQTTPEISNRLGEIDDNNESSSENSSRHSNQNDTPQGTTRQGKLKFKYDANLEDAVNPPNYKYNSVKVLDLEESAKLLQEQQKKQEELKAQKDALKLVQAFNIKMEAYEPEGKLTYRTPVVVDDADSDDNADGDELDYPD